MGEERGGVDGEREGRKGGREDESKEMVDEGNGRGGGVPLPRASRGTPGVRVL